MLTLRQGRVPLIWKYMNFEKLSSLTAKFGESPLPALTEGEAPTQYQSQLGTQLSQNQLDPTRQWVNWKRVLTYFTLLNSSVPTGEQLTAYRTSLEQVTGDKYLAQDQFCNVSSLLSNPFNSGVRMVRPSRRPS